MRVHAEFRRQSTLQNYSNKTGQGEWDKVNKQEKSAGEAHKGLEGHAQEFRNPTSINPQTCLKLLCAAESGGKQSQAPEPLLSVQPVKGQERKEV